MASYQWSDLRAQAEKEGGSSGGFPVVPAGEYDVKVATATVKPTSTGKEMIKIMFDIQSGPYAGQKLFDQLVVSPGSAKAMSILFRQLDALGAKSVLDNNGSLEQVAATIVNATAKVKVVAGEYRGEPKAEVKDIMPASSPLAGVGVPSIPQVPSFPSV